MHLEKDHLKAGQIMSVQIVEDCSAAQHSHGDIELLYILSGYVQVTVGSENQSLKERDILVINANREHSYIGSEGMLMARFLISLQGIKEMMGQSIVLLRCCSAREQHEAFSSLRFLIGRILNDILTHNNSQIYRNSLYYQMLHILTSNFLIPPEEIHYRTDVDKDELRLQEIFAYIRTNYRHNIRLKDLAQHLFLSETYVSKYISQKCGINFVGLVNHIRLEYAMDDLIESDVSIIHLAMDNGFVSVAAFNHYFQQAYQMNPSAFRKRYRQQRREQQERVKNIQKEQEVKQRIDAFLREEADGGTAYDRREITVQVDTAIDGMHFEKANLVAVINVGTAVELLDAGLRAQLLASQRRLGFRYVRFWNLYGEGMNFDIHAKGPLNFNRLDNILDFLLEHQLRPYIELGCKPYRILRTTKTAVRDDYAPNGDFRDLQEEREFYRQLAVHLEQRYGDKEVANWFFELRMKEHLVFQGSQFSYTPLSAADHQQFFREFDAVAAVLQQSLPSLRLGGGGFPVQHYGREELQACVERWLKNHVRPAFISMTGFPYHLEQHEGDMYFEKRITDEEFIRHNVQLMERVLASVGLAGVPIHLSEYAMSLSSRNAMNDSCYRGAFLMRTLISCVSCQNLLMGQWLFSDLHSEYKDTRGLLFGGSGLVTRDGIPKPAWFAFDFFHACHDRFLAMEEHCLVTGGEDIGYRLVCHNGKHLNYHYYMTPEDQVDGRAISTYLEDRDVLCLHIVLRHLKNGRYIIRQRRIDDGDGSIQDEWNELDCMEGLTSLEVRHLAKITMAHLSIRHRQVEDGTLQLDLELRPDEIRYLEISKSLDWLES